jgi:hypothetical protein
MLSMGPGEINRYTGGVYKRSERGSIVSLIKGWMVMKMG